LIGVLYLGPVLSPTLAAFIITGFVFGAVMGVLDVAMNTQGLAVEQQSARPLMSGLHGAYSVGGLIGALLGGVLVDLLGLMGQAVIISLICSSTVLFARPHLLPSAVDKGLSTTHFGWPTWHTLGLGVLCFLTLMGEGAFVDWSGLFLQTRFEVDAGFAATGFAMFSAGMAVSRFAGDGLRMRFGAVRLVRWSAVFTMAGTAAGLLSSNPVLTVAMFVLAGIGIGNIAPVLFAGGGRLEPNAPGRGIAAVTTLGYSGLLAGPPLIGIIAEFSGLGPALWLIVLSAFIIALGSRAVRALD
jgi:fucose permease